MDILYKVSLVRGKVDMPKERRKYPRISVTMIPVEMNIVSKTENIEMKKGIIKTISARGIGIETQNPFRTGELISLNFSLEQGYEFSNLKGRVVRVMDGLFCSILGLEFSEVPEEDKSRIIKYVDMKIREPNRDSITSQNSTVIFK
jgi:c-di-GMP-binding flagellar brake protein YcgR